MRLLDARALIYEGVAQLVDDLEVGYPHYAILSHTWAEEEVLFEDIPLGMHHKVVTKSAVERERLGYNTESRLYVKPDHFTPTTHRRIYIYVDGYIRYVGDGNARKSPEATEIASVASEHSDCCSDCVQARHEIVQQPLYGVPHVKVGWTKIYQAARRACEDGYDYIWIDTCCIDKSSSAELSEAINSMFKWYEDAGVCYAYLADVNLCSKMSEVDFNAQHRESNDCRVCPDGRPLPVLNDCTVEQVRQSRWLTRGWTLQELIAPDEVIFFDRSWHKITHLSAVTDLISDLTGIRSQAFYRQRSYVPELRIRKFDPEQFKVAEKLSWAAHRITTRVEDEAYCLLGLMGINMPLLYGEGKKAFARLQTEIIKTYPDDSIFAWEYCSEKESRQCYGQLFAPSPANFSWIGSLLRRKPGTWTFSRPYTQKADTSTVQNSNLQVWLHLAGEDKCGCMFGFLTCGFERYLDNLVPDPRLSIALRLRRDWISDHARDSESTGDPNSQPTKQWMVCPGRVDDGEFDVQAETSWRRLAVFASHWNMIGEIRNVSKIGSSEKFQYGLIFRTPSLQLLSLHPKTKFHEETKPHEPLNHPLI